MNTRVGNGFLLGFHGRSLPDWVIDFEARYGLGGVILFDRDLRPDGDGRNIESSDQLRALCREVHSLESYPMVFVDQEGGYVRRLKERHGFTSLPSAEKLCSLDIQLAKGALESSYRELAEHGIDFNLAPVVDLNTNPSNPNIGALERSFSAKPEEVKRCGEMCAEAAIEAGLQLCIKHYPGLGGAKTDSHSELTELGDTISGIQLALFEELCLRVPGSAILLSHGLVRQWDADWPVSLSPSAIKILRTASPDALVVTDDSQMEGLQAFCKTAPGAVRALSAGADMACIGNNLRDESEACVEAAEMLLDRATTSEEAALGIETFIRRVEERKMTAKRFSRCGPTR